MTPVVGTRKDKCTKTEQLSRIRETPLYAVHLVNLSINVSPHLALYEKGQVSKKIEYAKSQDEDKTKNKPRVLIYKPS